MRRIKLGLDIGSSKTSIYQVGAGVILSEPSVVAVTKEGRNDEKVVGIEAKKLFGKTSNKTQIYLPVFEGEIDKVKSAEIMLGSFFDKISLKKIGSSVRVAVAIPCGSKASSIKKRKDLLASQGIFNVVFVESPIATALGLNVPVTQSKPCFIIDMGGGTTNICALSLDGIIAGVSVNMGGANVDAMIIDHIESQYKLRIGLLTAERLKIEIGSLLDGDTASMVISGRDTTGGKPRSLMVNSSDLIEPIKAYVNKINEITEILMGKLPAEVSAEIRNGGIYLAGGMSKILGLEEYFYNNFSTAVKVSDTPELATAIGLGILQSDEKLLKRLKIQ